MKKINTSPISGALELLPAEQAVFTNLKNKIAEVYHRHGFLKIETPVIDRTEILFAKAGGDTEKQVYKVVKTAEAADEADQALRFDHTVPLARYVVEHENDLTFPFKATQIGRNFRGERAQKGRYREFYQCDIDIIGRGQLAAAYDAEIISTLLDAYKSFEIQTQVLCRINNRKILNGFLAELGLEGVAKTVFDIIDHAEKVEPEVTKKALLDAGLSEALADVVLKFININGRSEDVITKFNSLKIENETYKEGVKELAQVLELLEAEGLGEYVTADMKIVRGLDYYTGTVFEFCLPEYKKLGSIGGGGRYENLASNFTDQALPGTGGSIGLTRLYYVLTENNLLKSQEADLLDYCLVPISENEFEFAMQTAAKLRTAGYTVDINFQDRKLGDKLTYASKLAKNGVVIGESEVASGSLKAKDFATGEVKDLTL